MSARTSSRITEPRLNSRKTSRASLCRLASRSASFTGSMARQRAPVIGRTSNGCEDLFVRREHALERSERERAVPPDQRTVPSSHRTGSSDAELPARKILLDQNGITCDFVDPGDRLWQVCPV